MDRTLTTAASSLAVTVTISDISRSEFKLRINNDVISHEANSPSIASQVPEMESGPISPETCWYFFDPAAKLLDVQADLFDQKKIEWHSRRKQTLILTSDMSRLIAGYMESGAGRVREQVYIDGCPAHTFEEVFRPAKNLSGLAEERYIYFGEYDYFDPRKSGIAIYFRGVTANGWPTSIWIRKTLFSSDYCFDTLLDKLRRLSVARRNNPLAIFLLYGLGVMIQPKGLSKFAIEVESLSHFRIEKQK